MKMFSLKRTYSERRFNEYNSHMKVIFIGSQTIGYNCLKKVLELGIEVPIIFTMKAEPHEKWEHSVDEIALQKQIPLYVCSNLSVKDHLEIMNTVQPEAIFVVGWRKIIPAEILEVPKYGSIAFHASLLPKLRGFAPINWALLLDEKQTGITAFYMDSGIDTGDILAQKEIKITDEDDAGTLRKKVEKAAVDIISEFAVALCQGKAPKTKQKDKAMNYCCPRSPVDGLINWNDSSRKIFNLIRSLASPYPGAYTYYKGNKLYIWKSSIKHSEIKIIGVPGQIASIEKGKNVSVVTGNDEVLVIETVQEEDKEKVNAGTYFSSIRDRLGLDFETEFLKLKHEIKKLNKR